MTYCTTKWRFLCSPIGFGALLYNIVRKEIQRDRVVRYDVAILWQQLHQQPTITKSAVNNENQSMTTMMMGYYYSHILLICWLGSDAQDTTNHQQQDITTEAPSNTCDTSVCTYYRLQAHAPSYLLVVCTRSMWNHWATTRRRVLLLSKSLIDARERGCNAST
jgi:hypothetical protein